MEENAIERFCLVTATTPEYARFHLESCAWQLDAALHSFYESDPVEDVNPLSEEEPPLSPLDSSLPQRESLGLSKDMEEGKKKDKAGSSRKKPGVATLSDLNKKQDPDSDSDGPQEYYAGGEKSGMMVQDPTTGHKNVESIFHRARQFGAREGAVETQQPSSSRSAFIGTGHTLSGVPRQEEVPNNTVTAAPESISHTITFWRNGFTVDDGPIRKLEDPLNAPFLTSIHNGECPRELEPVDRNTSVNVILIRKDEDWKPPTEPKYKAFQGTGRTLGSSDVATTSSVASAKEINQASTKGIMVDDSKPSTSIQLRLSDGTRMVARFNHHHTISDLRGFIDAARPSGMRSYQLQVMGFPPRVLIDSAQTIEEAGLMSAVIIQKTVG